MRCVCPVDSCPPGNEILLLESPKRASGFDGCLLRNCSHNQHDIWDKTSDRYFGSCGSNSKTKNQGKISATNTPSRVHIRAVLHNWKRNLCPHSELCSKEGSASSSDTPETWSQEGDISKNLSDRHLQSNKNGASPYFSGLYCSLEQDEHWTSGRTKWGDIPKTDTETVVLCRGSGKSGHNIQLPLSSCPSPRISSFQFISWHRPLGGSMFGWRSQLPPETARHPCLLFPGVWPSRYTGTLGRNMLPYKVCTGGWTTFQRLVDT